MYYSITNKLKLKYCKERCHNVALYAHKMSLKLDFLLKRKA